MSRPSWYKPDASLAARMVFTMFLLGTVYIVFALILRYAFGAPWILLVVGALAIGGIQFFFADKIALGSMHARIVPEQEAPALHELVARVAAQANLPEPKVAVIQSQIPNAFATGRDKHHAVVAVTNSLCERLSPAELEAVLAHEMAHIVNRDMLVMTVATFFSMVASLLLQNLLSFGGGGPGYRRRRNDSGANIAVVLLASLATYVLSFVLIRALSRYRELAADRGSALITGTPEHLATALIHIDEIVRGPAGAHIPQSDFRQVQGVEALCIMPALRRSASLTVFSTHPSLEQRLRQLHHMQAQMESAAGSSGESATRDVQFPSSV